MESEADELAWRERLNEMVDKLLITDCIKSALIEAAFRSTPRHAYIRRLLPQARDWETLRDANNWTAVDQKKPSIEAQKVIYNPKEAILSRISPSTSSSSAPDIMAIMLEALELAPGQKVLEIGTGTGYNAAIIARVLGEYGQVYSIENQSEVAEEARQNLSNADIRNAKVILRDGGVGYEEEMPFDRIISTASVFDVPPSWMQQLKTGGILVAPFWIAAGYHPIAKLRNSGAGLVGGFVNTGGFMALTGSSGYNESTKGRIDATRDSDLSDLLQNPVHEDGFSFAQAATDARARFDDFVMFASVSMPDKITRVKSEGRISDISVYDVASRSLACVWPPHRVAIGYGNELAYNALRDLHTRWKDRGMPSVRSFSVTTSIDSSSPTDQLSSIERRTWHSWRVSLLET